MRSFACTSALALLGCLLLASTAGAQTTLEKIQSSGTVRYAIAPEPPVSDFKSATEITGAEPDIAKKIFEELGAPKIDASVADWGALIPGLLARRFDVVATGLYIRPERCKAVLFSKPQLCMAEAFMVQKGNPLGVTTYEELKAKNVRVAAVSGGAEERRALEAGIARDNVYGVTNIFDAVALLQSGRVDVLSFPDTTLRDALGKVQDANLEIVAPIAGEPIQCSATAFHPRDKELRDAYDAVLDKLQASGELKAIQTQYGFDPELLAKVSRDELCGAAN